MLTMFLYLLPKSFGLGFEGESAHSLNPLSSGLAVNLLPSIFPDFLEHNGNKHSISLAGYSLANKNRAGTS